MLPHCAAAALNNTAAVKAAGAGLPCILSFSLQASGRFQEGCDFRWHSEHWPHYSSSTDRQLSLLGFTLSGPGAWNTKHRLEATACASKAACCGLGPGAE